MSDDVPTPSGVLLHWLDGNPDAPSLWRRLASLLATAPDAPLLWAALEPLQVPPLVVLTVARNAWERTEAELRRMTSSDESKAYRRVQRALLELRQAIEEQSPLDPREATLLDLTGGGREAAQVLLAWRDPPPGAADFFKAYTMTVPELLDALEQMLEGHQERQPPRAVLRHRDRPREDAFVRWAEWFMRCEFGEAPSLALAHLVNVVMPSTAPVGADDVRAILKNSPFASART